MKIQLLILGIVISLSCCVSPNIQPPTLVHQFEIGQPIDTSKVAQITEGKTTEQEAIALLGPPQHIQERPDGARILVYQHYHSQIGGPSVTAMRGGISNKMLFLGIRDGIVKKKWQNSSYQPTSTFTGFTN